MKYFHRSEWIVGVFITFNVALISCEDDYGKKYLNKNTQRFHEKLPSNCPKHTHFISLIETVKRYSKESPINLSSDTEEPGKSTILPSVVTTTTTKEAYPTATTTTIETADLSSTIISTSVSMMPTPTSPSTIEPTVLAMTVEPKISFIDPNDLQATHTTYVTESITTTDPTEDVEFYSTIPTIPKTLVTKRTREREFVYSTEHDNEIEPISSTKPPEPIPTTLTITEDSTSSTQEPTSTIAPTTTVLPTTEHTGVVIEPTPTTDYLLATKHIVRTTPVPVIDPTMFDETFGTSNTSFAVPDATETPSLPSNLSTVLVV